MIRLVDNGPEITFQPPSERPVSPVAPIVPVAPTATSGWIRPAEELSPAPQHDSLFEPLPTPVPPAVTSPRFPSPQRAPAEEIVSQSHLNSLFEPPPTPVSPPAAPRQIPAAPSTPAATPSRKPGPRKRRDGDSIPNQVRAPEINAENSVPDADESRGRPLPKLRSHETGLSDRETTSQTTAGWIIIWVVVGLGILGVVACIWFGSGPASGNDVLPVLPARGPS